MTKNTMNTNRSAVQTASAAMGRMNAAIDPQRLNAMMMQFARQNDQMNVTEEMMDDMMGELLASSFIFCSSPCVLVPHSMSCNSVDSFDDTDELEVDAVTQGVLAEIGVEFEATVSWIVSTTSAFLNVINCVCIALLS